MPEILKKFLKKIYYSKPAKPIRKIYKPSKEEKKHIKRLSSKKPIELKGITKSDKSAIVYVGNGANGSTYSSFFGNNEHICKSFSDLGGIHNYCSIVYVEPSELYSGNISVVEGFTHPDDLAVFNGFVLRKKLSNEWYYYTVGSEWMPLSYDMPEFKMFHDGDILPASVDDEPVVYVLESRWVDPSGNPMNCGYKMFRNKLMAHALGGMDGKTYHNTIAALEHSIKAGYSYFETDLSYTEDKHLMMCHGWTEKDCKILGMSYNPSYEHMTYDMARELRIHGNPIIDAHQFYEYIKNTDSKYTFEIDYHPVKGKKAYDMTKTFVQDFCYDEDVFSRLLIQVYSQGMFKNVDSVHHFEVYQYSLGGRSERLHEVIQYCLDNGICSVAIRAAESKPEYISELKKAGLYVLGFTVEGDLEVAKTLYDLGVDTLCTNFITNNMIANQKDGMGYYPYYVYYNSGCPDATSSYDDNYIKKNNNCLEFQDPHIWNNSGDEALKPCGFSVSGKTFIGWKMYTKIDNIIYWICKDELYRRTSHLKEGTTKVPEIFSESYVLPKRLVKKNAVFMMVAIWE